MLESKRAAYQVAFFQKVNHLCRCFWDEGTLSVSAMRFVLVCEPTLCNCTSVISPIEAPVPVGVLELAGEDGQGGGRTFSPMCSAPRSD